MRSLAVLCLGLVLFVNPTAFGECRRTNAVDFQSYLKSNPQIQNIVFFASWCLTCKPSLAGAGKETALVGVFDDYDNIKQIWLQFNQNKSVCFFDADSSIRKAWQVSALPHSIKYR